MNTQIDIELVLDGSLRGSYFVPSRRVARGVMYHVRMRRHARIFKVASLLGVPLGLLGSAMVATGALALDPAMAIQIAVDGVGWSLATFVSLPDIGLVLSWIPAAASALGGVVWQVQRRNGTLNPISR